jgi:pseudoazurin
MRKMFSKMNLALVLAVGSVVAIAALPVNAAEIEVKMLNKGAKGMMVFEPDFVKAATGDTIHFVAADKGHDAESIEGMVPEGATPFIGEMGKDLSVKLDKEGFYGVRCKPHFGMGMVMLVEVGKGANADAAKAAKMPPKARQKFDELFADAAK